MRKRMLALFLSFCVIFTGIPVNVYANEVSTIEEGAGEESGNAQQSEVGITRIEWLKALTAAYDMTVETTNYPDNYYSDIDDSYEFYHEVMLATEFGLVDVEAGEEFSPDEAATREFVVHTLNVCMGHEKEGDAYTFIEAEEVTYPDDIEVAVEQEWFALNQDKQFLPDKQVLTTEMESLLALAEADAAGNIINEENEDSYDLQEDVIEIPENVVIEMIDVETYTLSGAIDADPVSTLEVGDKVAFVSGEFPVVKEIVSINNSNGVIVLHTQSVAAEDGFASIDYEGSMDVSLLDVQTFSDDIELTYIVGGTLESEYQDGVEYQSAEGLEEEDVSAVKVVKTYIIPEKVAAEFDLGDNATAQITCTISNPSVDYKIKTSAPYVNFNSTVTFSCNVSMDVLGAINVPDNISLAKVPVGYIGYMEATLELSSEGEATATLIEDISMGVKWTEAKGFQLTKKFKKQAFTLQAKVDATVGVKVTAAFDAIVLKGDVYGEIGAKANADAISYGDGLAPKNCVHLTAHMYAELGCGVELDLLFEKFDKSFSKVQTVFDASNSPVKLVFHYEEGKAVSRCTNTRGNTGSSGSGSGSSNASYKYYTPANSQYGYSGGNTGVDSSGESYSTFDYEILDDGTIEITGYRGNYASLSIPSTIDGYTVTKVGGFRDHPELRMVVIPDTVIEIGSYAFASCSNLTTVVMSKNIELISGWAFKYCSSLKSIEFPDSLQVIGAGSFEQCDSLTEVSIPKDLVAADNYDRVGWMPFVGCDNLKKIVYRYGRMVIPTEFFEDCPAIAEVIIPDSVTEIEARAFENIESLTKVVLSKNITKINDYAFGDCTSLRDIELPNRLEYLGSGAFDNCVSLTEISIPKTLKTVDTSGGFGGCENLRKVTIEDGLKVVPNCLFYNCGGLTEIVIPDSVTEIGESAFAYCENLTTVVLSKNLTRIGKNAFYDCENLKNITLPNGLTSLEENAFSDCKKLELIAMPKTVTQIGEKVFKGCISLKKVTWSTALTSIPENTFYDCHSLSEITGVDKVVSICEYAFYQSGLKSMDGFDNVRNILPYAFYNSDSMTSISLPDTAEQIGNYAFYDNDALTSINIPNSVTLLGNSCFEGCDELVDVSLGMGLTTIAKKLFKGCTKLINVVVPYNVKRIESEAFAANMALKSITLPRSVRDFYSGIFSYPGLITIYGISGTRAEKYAIDNSIAFKENTTKATKVTLSETSCTLMVGNSFQLIPTVAPLNYSEEITYKSLNPNVATVTEDGFIHAKGVGSTAIKVIVGNASATCKVTVWQPVTRISLNYTSISLHGNDTYQLTASIYPDNATNKDVVWESSDPTIATVTQDGLVTAKKMGNCRISVRAKDSVGASAGCDVYVLNTVYKVSDVSDFQSSHPYDAYCDETWIYTAKDVRKVKVTFDRNTFVEEYCDYIYIFDKNGDQVGKYTGSELSGKTITVNGDTVKVLLKADGSGCEYGFKVTSVEVEKIPKYNIAFNGNGSTSGSMKSLTGRVYDKSYTLSANAFKRTGYKFIGWNTKKDGSGKSYADKASVKNLTNKNGATVTLYAQWQKVKYTITYNLNGGTNASNPSAYYITSATITLKNPTRKGYTFKGWYSDSACKNKVTQIAKGSTGNKTLYAKWSPIKYQIIFDDNGATSGKMSSLKNCSYNSKYTLTANKFKKKGYTFVGWNTKADGSGKSYADKAVVKSLSAKNGDKVRLYAQWEANTYKIKFYANGAESGKMSTITVSYNQKKTLSKNKFTYAGYKFVGWNTKADGSGKSYDDKEKIKNLTSADGKVVKLYAQWKKVKYSIQYVLNDGKNNKKNPSAYTVTSSTIKLKEPTRKGYTFMGWYTDKKFKNKITKIEKGSTGNIKLYAKWKKNK